MVLLTATLVSSQNLIHYEVLHDDPQLPRGMLLYASPLGINYSNNIGLLFGLGGSYTFKGKFSAELDIRRSYTERINLFFRDYEFGKQFGNCEPVSSMRTFMLAEIKGQYYLGSLILTNKVKVTLDGGREVMTYTKVPAKRLVSFPIRMGYTYYQSVMNTTRVGFDNGVSLFSGVEANNSGADVKEIHGFANYSSYFLSLGLGIYVKDDLSIIVEDPQKKFSGKKARKESHLWYVDILLPIRQEIENVKRVERTLVNGILEVKEREYILNEHTPKTNYGFKSGLRSTLMGSATLSMILWVETGYRPGLTDIKDNFFLMVGLDFALMP